MLARLRDRFSEFFSRYAPPAALPRLPALLTRALVALLAGYALWLIVQMAPARLFYKGELEWMEGGILGHVLRVMEGKPLYGPPSVEFTPYIYTPFYYWLCAGLGAIFGPTVSLLRCVSLVSFFGSALLIVLFVRRTYGSYLPGVIGAGLFAATFRLGGAWFDIARGDSLVVMLLLLCATLLFCFQSRGTAIAAGISLALAFLTKQSSLLPMIALVGWAVVCREKRLLWFAACAAGISLAVGLTLQITSGGWFGYYVFSLPSQHPLLDDWKILFWKNDVFGVLIVAGLLLFYEAAASLTFTKKELVRSLGFFLFVGGVTAQVWSSRFHMGMYDNVLMPFHALLGLGTGLALGRLSAAGTRIPALEIACHVALLGTIWRLEYPVEAQVPSESHIKQEAEFRQKLTRLPAKTWIAFHSTPAVAAKMPPRAHFMALVDVDRGGGPVAKVLHKNVRTWLKNQTAPAIVWSIRDPSDAWFRSEMQRYYRRSRSLMGPPPLTGWGQRATEVWVPKTQEELKNPQVEPQSGGPRPHGRRPRSAPRGE